MDNRVDILIVEDNPDEAELALLALEKYRVGRRIHVSRDCAEALDFLRNAAVGNGKSPPQLPCVILLDLKLPRMDGLDVLRTVKENPKTKDIPVVILTSSNHEKDIVESYELGANSYVVKPVNFEAYTRVLDEIGRYWLFNNCTPKP